MGAAKHKQKRKEERLNTPVKKQRRGMPSVVKKIIGTVAACLIIIVVATVLFSSSGLLQRYMPGVRIGGQNISVAEYNFNYTSYVSSFVSQYNDYLTTIGLDTTKPYTTQKSFFSKDMTWAQYFEKQTLDTIQLNVALSSAAKAENVTLNEDDVNNVNNYINTVKDSAKQEGVSEETYLNDKFGKGMNMSLLKTALERAFLAERYRLTKTDSYNFSDKEIEDYYNNHKADFDNVTYHSYYIPNSSSSDPTNTDQAKAEAKTKGDNMLNAITTESSFRDQALLVAAEADKTNFANNADPTIHKDAKKSTITPTDMADWLYDDARKAGDKSVFVADAGVYVAYYMSRSRSDYNTVDVRQILAKYELTGDATTPTAEQEAAAKSKADSVYAELKAGGSTEDMFISLAKAKSDESSTAQNGGLYEAVYKEEMVTQFNDWCFDPSRKVGDIGLVKTDYGYHIIYFKGFNKPYWQIQAKDKLHDDTYNTFKDDLLKKYPISKNPLGMMFASKK